MSERVYGYDEAWAAMCIIEEIIDPQLADTPWHAMRENAGITHMRDVVLGHLAGPCDAAWDRAQELFESAWDIWDRRRQRAEVKGEPFLDEKPQEPGSFDYEFVPFWLRACVDWTGDVPRVKGSGT